MPTKDYRTDLLKRLSSPDYASKYLKAALDETLEDGDMDAFLLALKNVVEASGSVGNAARKTKISRQHLYKILSGDGNPTLDTLTSVLSSVGLSINFSPQVRKSHD
jgi:probable addiction module antidote protein